jgi:hypothetical protein
MTYQHQEFPAARYGPNGEVVIVNSEEETPEGFGGRKKADPNEGTKTAVAPANSTISAEKASKTTDAVSRASTDVAKAAKAGVGGAGNSPTGANRAAISDEGKGADPNKVTLDAHGHVYDPTLHAGTGSKTKAGLWRMKVGVPRPAPAPGYPLDL